MAFLAAEAAPELAAAAGGGGLGSLAMHIGDAGKIAYGLNSMLNLGKNIKSTFFAGRKHHNHKQTMMNPRPGRQLGPRPGGPMQAHPPPVQNNLIETRK